MLSRRALLLASPAFAQDPTFSSNVNVINLLATVRDKRGQLIQNLTEEDFILTETGKPQKIRYFSQQTDLPLRLGLLVDTSMSQEKVIPAERAAAYRFLDQVLREKLDRVFLIQFDTLARVRLGFSSNRSQLEGILNDIDTPTRKELRAAGGSGTAFFDAIGSGAELMKAETGRKALIVLSDGVDSSSDQTLATAIELALRADTLVYTVYFTDPAFYSLGFGVPNGHAVMARLAKETGGGFFEVSKKMTIEAIFQAIEQELRSQYSIGYVSDIPVGFPAFRKIHLSTRQKGLVVQTRDGYWPKRP
ncbi:VWA domain-containing protein [Bryobacter aggregatus]|uniref:VWA domain-containing protein n=1 Tax=Bryobacter aggregatus TaxID=360054 RepID=UPI0004E27CA0|nr:VWA domain-containing protein [Bryobacter aggregatus]